MDCECTLDRTNTVLVILYMVFCALGAGPVMWLYFDEVLPLRIKVRVGQSRDSLGVAIVDWGPPITATSNSAGCQSLGVEHGVFGVGGNWRESTTGDHWWSLVVRNQSLFPPQPRPGQCPAETVS